MRSTRTLILVEVALAVAIAAALNILSARLPINVAGGSINLCMLPLAVVALRRGWIAGAVAGALFGSIDLLLEPTYVHPAQLLLDYPLPYLFFGLGVGLFSSLYNKAAAMDGRRAVLANGGQDAAGVADSAAAADDGSDGTSTAAASVDASAPGAIAAAAAGQAPAAPGTSAAAPGASAPAPAAAPNNRPIGRFVVSSVAIVIIAMIVGGLFRYLPHVLSGVLYFSEYAAGFFEENPSLLLPGAMDGGLNVWIYSLIYNISYLLPSVIGAAICTLVVMPALALAVPVQAPERIGRGKLAKAA